MSEFDTAIATVIRHEGGFVNHIKDPGGATNYGISLRFLESVGDFDGDGWLDGDFDHDGDVDVDDIRGMTEEQAIGFYYTHWWEKYNYSYIHDQGVATRVFDIAVNMGGKQAHKLLQRSVRAFSVHLVDDGILGPKTLQIINTAPPALLEAAYRAQLDGFYRMLVALKPEARSDFLNGWLNRVHDSLGGHG